MWIKRRIKVFIAKNYRKYRKYRKYRYRLIYASCYLRNSIDDKIWYWKSLRKAKKKYPKDTPMREMMIYNEINAMAMARQEEEIEKLWGPKAKIHYHGHYTIVEALQDIKVILALVPHCPILRQGPLKKGEFRTWMYDSSRGGWGCVSFLQSASRRFDGETVPSDFPDEYTKTIEVL